MGWLFLQCDELSQASDMNNLKLWEDVYHIECVHSCIRKVTFCGVPWKPGNHEFLKFVLEVAYLLEEMTIHLPSGSHSGMRSVIVKLKLSALTSAKWANDQCKLKIIPGR